MRSHVWSAYFIKYPLLIVR